MDGAVHGSSNDDDRMWKLRKHRKHQLTLQVLRNLYQQIPLPPVEHTELSHKLEEYAGVYENPAYGELKVELAKNGLYLHFKDWLLPMEHFHYDTFRVRGVKEDTIFITMPMTYHYEELTGKLDGFSLKLEPEVDPVWFAKRVAKE